MRMVDLIHKKRYGGQLSAEEIRYLIQGCVSGDIPDYQMAAWAMAVCFQGMTAEETAELTLAMAASGDTADLGRIRGIKVDKHSTGGVGDKTTLVLAPLVAAAGVPVAKMSGRGLGHTGGTIDKLESIPGFTAALERERFIEQVNRCGVAVISQSGNLAPADKKLYALRDVTATVESIPLIASSIMSKKMASGADAICLDVKVGSGAFMKSRDDAFELARTMIAIGTQVGRETAAVVSGMDQPLGCAVGNSLEVMEAIETLRGNGPRDVEELCLALGSQMLVLGRKAADIDEARRVLRGCIADGSAFGKFKQFVQAQGGDIRALEQPDLLPSAQRQIPVFAGQTGYVAAIEAERVGVCAMMLGAGRETKEAAIDWGAGILLRKKVGDSVVEGEVVAEMHANEMEQGALDQIGAHLSSAFIFSRDKADPPPLIYAVADRRGVHLPIA